jgi:CBS-domain-containing membrane protein
MSDADKHTCRSIMTTNQVVIKQADSVAKAMRMLLDNRLLGLPVVDDDGRYLGMFLRSRLVALLLPTIVQLEERLPELARLLELGFMTDTLDDAHDRFRKVASDPVSKYLQTDTPILRLDTPVMNAVLYLYRTRSYLPVVDEASGTLLGVVSTWDVLARIAGSSA